MDVYNYISENKNKLQYLCVARTIRVHAFTNIGTLSVIYITFTGRFWPNIVFMHCNAIQKKM